MHGEAGDDGYGGYKRAFDGERVYSFAGIGVAFHDLLEKFVDKIEFLRRYVFPP